MIRALSCAFSCSPVPLSRVGCAATLAPGDHEFAIAHQQLRRSYLVRDPPQVAGGTALPLVLNFHGGGHANVQKQYSRMDAAADRDGYIAIYPDGSGGIGGR